MEVPSTNIQPSPDGSFTLVFQGNWTKERGKDLPSFDQFETALPSMAGATAVRFDISRVERWDSVLVARLFKISQELKSEHIIIDSSSLPAGLIKLLDIASTCTGSSRSRASLTGDSYLISLGKMTYGLVDKCNMALEFLGLCVVLIAKTVIGKRGFKLRDLSYFIQEVGAHALPIVSLISVLVGLIFGFIGGLQLEQFGAQLYVANLVGIAMIREMGSMMVGIVLAGRTGAAYAAQLGTMQVNEEIDAFQTFGIDPVDFLVIPRILALVLMMPLLSIYSNFLGIIGGMVAGTSLYDITLTQYIEQTSYSFAPKDFWIGVVKSAIYGLIVGLCGCYRGFKCGRTAAAVGEATTAAVVTSIVLIIVADAIAAVVCAALSI